MSKDSEIDYSTTAATNTDVGGISIDEGMAPSAVNNAMRQILKQRADAVTRHVAKGAGSYTAAKIDHNQFWRCTGAVTINLTAAATLGAGWCLWVRANGGAVTIDPNGAENIDGASASLVVADGQTVLILCTASAFFTVMAGSGTAGDVVRLTATQTLTNKTLTTPTITLAQSATPTPTAEGDVQWDTDDNAVVVGDGASQKVFRANDWEKIFTGTFSGATSQVFTGLSAYRAIRMRGSVTMSTDGASLRFQYSTDNGSSYVATAGEYQQIRTFNTGTTLQAVVVTSTSMGLDGETGIDNAASGFINFTLDLMNFNLGVPLLGQGHASFRETAGGIRTCWVEFDTVGATARNAFRIVSSSGNIAGHMIVEGVRG